MSRLATPLSVLAIAGASIALVACGSGDSSSSGGNASTNASGGNGNQNAAFEKYRQCLKDNGVTLPDRGQRPDGGQPPTGAPPSGGDGNDGPGFFGGGQTDAKTQKAMQACAKLRPQLRGGYGRAGGSGSGRAPRQNIKAFTPYLTCLKDQGLDVKVSDGFNALRGLKASDPEVQAAFKACQSKLPQRPDGAQGGNGQQQTTTSPSGSTT